MAEDDEFRARDPGGGKGATLNKIVGIDCATEGKRVGLALAELSSGRLRVRDFCTGAERPPVECIAEWIGPDDTALLALDAPLGWPVALADSLPSHRAGEPITARPDQLFHRETDRFIHERVGRRPLEVGADRIARTAVAALDLLEAVRSRLGESVVVADHPRNLQRLSAIEVYPAATLAARGQICSGYKRTAQGDVREKIIADLERRLELPDDRSLLVRHADVLDAVICTLAGFDFLRGEAMGPQDPQLAAREGWIWVRTPER